MRFLKNIAGAIALIAASMSANAVQVSYTVNYSGNVWGTGTFTGVDNNADNLLTLNELTSFDGNNNIEGAYVTLAGLSGFGSFNLATNFWNSDGSGWGQSGIAFFSWNGDGNSVNRYWATVQTTVESNGVPEPGSVALLGLGLAALASKSRRKVA